MVPQGGDGNVPVVMVRVADLILKWIDERITKRTGEKK